MVLVRLDLCSMINYNLNRDKFIRWNKLIYAKSFEEMEIVGEGDEIMEQSIEYLKRYCNSNLNHGFKDFLEEEILEASEKAEEQTLLDTAKNLLAEGVPIKTIMKATGLSKSQIEKLQD